MGGAEEPALRAGLMKAVVASVRRLPESSAERVLARIDPASIEAIAAATRMEWLPVEYMLELDDSLLGVLGSRGFHQHWRQFGAGVERMPMFKPIVGSALRMFTTPRGIFNLIPRAYGMVSRNFGTMRCEPFEGEQRVDLIWTELPRLPRLRLVGLASEASLHAPFDLLGVDGSVEFDESRYDGTTLALIARW